MGEGKGRQRVLKEMRVEGYYGDSQSISVDMSVKEEKDDVSVPVTFDKTSQQGSMEEIEEELTEDIEEKENNDFF